MERNRSILTAMGILIGPMIAYLSFLAYKAQLNELIQLCFFLLFFITAFELAMAQISLSGCLVILLLPAMPVALYLVALPNNVGMQLTAKGIISFWVVSVLAGAILGRLKPIGSHPKLMGFLTSMLILAVGAGYFLLP